MVDQTKAFTPITVDMIFDALMTEMERQSPEQITNVITSCFHSLPEVNQQMLIEYHAKYDYWGALLPALGNYAVFKNRGQTLHEHAGDFRWLYGRLSDYRSKITLYSILSNWYTYQPLSAIKESMFGEYFDLDIMRCTRNEVFVDLGAYIGDTVRNYMGSYGENCYKRIYCYEITPSTFHTLQNNLLQYPGIICRQKGASDQAGIHYIAENADISSNVLASQGSIPVEAVTLDEDISEPITFLKMDIEGAEQKALQGSARHIRENRPKLALSVYHRNDDLWQIPRLVDSLCEGYRFYLRYHGGNLTPSETTLLAIYGE